MYAKFRCAPLRIKKAVGILRELITTTTTTITTTTTSTTTTRVAFRGAFGSKNLRICANLVTRPVGGWGVRAPFARRRPC